MSKLMRVAIMGLVLFSVITVCLSIPKENKFMSWADEGYYYTYAGTVAKNGIGVLPVLLREYLNKKGMQLFPHPARIGHTLMTVFWFKIFPATYVSLAYFSSLCFILLLIISFYYSNKFFGKDLAYFSTLLLSCSPLLMHSGKRCLQDSNVNLFWILSVWLFFDFLVNKKQRTFLIFLCVYSISITIKESSLALSVFFILFYFLYKYKYRNEVSDYYLVGLITIPISIVGASYALLLGGFNNVISLIKFLWSLRFQEVVTNAYCFLNDGPWYKMIIDYLIVSPITTLLTIGYSGYLLISRKVDWKIAYFLVYLIITFGIFSNLKYTKIVRFIEPLEIVISLFSVLAIFELFKQGNKRYQMCFVFLAILIIFFLNVKNFIYLFNVINIYDPTSHLLLMYKKIIPFIATF